jgi:hypothetical protein
MLALLRRYFDGIPESGKIFFNKSNHSYEVIFAICSAELHPEHIDRVLRNAPYFSIVTIFMFTKIFGTQHQEIHKPSNT